MVLVNTLTVEAINTALIALQRGQSIVVGGEKETTVNNITISNSGGSGGNGLDFTPQINALDKRVGLLEKAEEVLREENERQNERLEILEGLGISNFTFDEVTRELSIELENGDTFDTTITSESFSMSVDNGELIIKIGNNEQRIPLPSGVQADWTETDSTDPSFIKNKIPIWITNGSATDDNAQALFDLVHPIGEIYVQYPATDNPNTLYNISGVITSTWVEQSYNGAFFRASGGNAGAFQTTLGTAQGYQNAYHRHEGTYTGGPVTNNSNHSANTYVGGPVTNNSSHSAYTSTGGMSQYSTDKFHTYVDLSVGVSNNITLTGTGGGASGGQWFNARTLSINHAHTHSHDHVHNHDHVHSITTGYNGNSTDTEARPTNYTIKIWKRTA